MSPEPDKPFVRDFSAWWALPHPPKARLRIFTLILLAAIAAVVVLALLSPLIRLARDSAVALFA